MHGKALTTYYFLSTAVLAAGFFVIQPATTPELKNFQDNVKQQFSVAWQQTIGDQPWFDSVQFVFGGVENFYQQAATTTISMLQDREADADISYVFGTMYHDVVTAFQTKEMPKVAGATTEANNELPIAHNSSFDIPNSALPVNPQNGWVTIQDNATGQLYCLAIYNDTVNKYLGPCQRDYH